MQTTISALESIKALDTKSFDNGSLSAGYLTIEYTGRLTPAVKAIGVKKDYNAYGRKCNIAFVTSVNSGINELYATVSKMLEGNDSLRVSYNLI